MAARDGIRESACDGERVGGRRVGRYGAEQDTGIDRSSTRPASVRCVVAPESVL